MRQSAVAVVIGERTKILTKKYVDVRKIEKVVVVSGSQGAAENRAAGLTARHCDVSLTLHHR